MTAPIHLRAGGVSLVLDSELGAVPSALHWGQDLGDLTDDDLTELRRVSQWQPMPNSLDERRPAGIVAEHGSGWFGTPGLRGSRDGADWSPVFERTASETQRLATGSHVSFQLRDTAAHLALRLDVGMATTGLVSVRAVVRNESHEPYRLEGLDVALPVPTRAAELLDLTGRHVRERSPQRGPFTVGSHVREGRRGRTGTDATLLVAAGVPGFGFRSGEVWAVHVAWSGNHRTRAERLPDGVAVLGGGELLLPDEVVLAQGEEYATPTVYYSYGQGLDEVSRRVHDWLRARPQHPRGPRPVVLNTWEAVYFDHELDVLSELATLGAGIGVERFVLDDGWFHGRRHDRAGLGDWHVDTAVWPDGLHPLVDHVRGLGMEFGLWVEPEMVNEDSDLARAHPDWLLQTGGRLPPASRHQQVLDLGHPVAFAEVLERLDALLAEYDIAYLKWDHNRDLVDAGTGPRRAPGVHRQTAAFYALVDELRRRHPSVEIESCSSGGGRVDLEVLQRTDRIWTSDSIDALERQQIQRWTSLLVPPEMLGAHVGAPRSHTSGRTLDLAFRAGTALFGQLGIEWDLRTATPGDRRELARWIALYREIRPLLATGTVVRSDHVDPALWVHGVVAADRSEAVYALVAVATGVTAPPGPVTLPGLDPDATYRVAPLPPGDVVTGPARSPLTWWGTGATVSGSVLGRAGVQAPALFPEQLVLLRVTRQ